MKTTIKSCLFILSLVVSSFSFANALTEESVNNLLTKVDNAVNSLNIEEVASTLSDNVAITMHITMLGQTQVMKPSREEYIALLKKGWAVYKNYKYSKSNVQITIKNNKALVTADITESMIIQEKNVSGTSKEEITIELINNKPLITTMTGYTSM